MSNQTGFTGDFGQLRVNSFRKSQVCKRKDMDS